MLLQPSLVSATNGKLYTLLRQPVSGRPEAIAVIVPPFAEEANKSRHMFSQLSQHLADAGIASLLFDYYGTGESFGNFEDASLASYTQDLVDVIAQAKALDVPVHLVCVRLGALVALNAWRDLGGVAKVVFWNPVVSGKLLVNQFFRLRLASALTAAKGKKETAQTIRDELTSTGQTEIAGYSLGLDLVEQLENASLDGYTEDRHTENSHADSDGFSFPQTRLFEVNAVAREELTPLSQNVISKLAESTVSIDGICVSGSQFWSTQEITLAPSLIQETVGWLVEGGR